MSERKKRSAPVHTTQHDRRYGAKYHLIQLPDGRKGMELMRGVLDGSDGMFYPQDYEYPDTRPVVKVLCGEQLIYCPSTFIRRTGIDLEYR